MAAAASSGEPPSVGLFSESYWEAREKFREAAKVAGAELTPLLVKEADTEHGDYTIDVAVLKGSGKGLIVHSSGVHGVEGYAGSAIQTAALHSLAAENQKLAKTLPATVVFVHAVNPYGMAHFRRFNESNVDLNRNAVPADVWPHLLSRDPNIAGYEDLLSAFVPDEAPWSTLARLQMFGRVAYYLATYGMLNIKRAMVAGTYSRPEGIYYGGTKLERSHELLFEFLSSRFKSTRTEDVVWVDVHTGLGPSGLDVLMTSHGQKEDALKAFPDAPEVQETGETGGGGQSAGYELTTGFVGIAEIPWVAAAKIAAIHDGHTIETVSAHPFVSGDQVVCRAAGGGLLNSPAAEASFIIEKVSDNRLTLHEAAGAPAVAPPGQEGSQLWKMSTVPSFYSRAFDSSSSGKPFMMTQEFGTVPPIYVGVSVILENAGYWHDRARHEYWRTFTRDTFYVRTEEWKSSVLKRGIRVFEQLLEWGKAR